jgi:cytosine/adenosine deaminase-related metal-dependent hydrolase
VTTPASPVRAFRARWIVPGDGPPIRDGVLAMAGQLIQYVGPDAGVFPAEDLGNVAILPGLVNSHTHLEFSGLEAPLGQSGMRFTDWIAAVVQHRRARDADGPVERSQAIRRGIIESLGHGVTAIGEISSGDWPTGAVSELPMEGIVFWELLGASPERIEAEHQSARTFLERNSETEPAQEHGCPAPVPFSLPSGWLRGLSPHAPYSVHPELLSRAVGLARTFDVPLAMHLAESSEEIELLADRRGPFVPLLESLSAWHPQAIPLGLRPMDILRVLADAPRVLVVHGNYLTDDEIDFLGANSDRMSVVCPRTHAFFQHRRYPLARMLAAGVRIALGTDSRASTPDLNLLAEMRQVARDYSEIPPDQILQMATINGARALGLDGHCGTLVVGKHANLAIVALPDGEADCYESLLATDTPVTATVYRGQLIAGF